MKNHSELEEEVKSGDSGDGAMKGGGAFSDEGDDEY